MRLKTDKGVAGLTILMTLIVMLFAIGLLVMIFAIMGDEMRKATYDTTTLTKANESITLNETTAVALSVASLRDVTCSLSYCSNKTTPYTAVPITNYSESSECRVLGAMGLYNGNAVNCTYSYTYEADNTATDVMNDTVSGISSVVDWYDIFIVIGAMVVLILLVVLIITSIKSSGMIDTGSSSGNKNVGTA